MIDHAKRLNRIGGSQVAALFGAHPYRTEHAVWLEVTGRTAPEDNPPSDEMVRGQIFEKAILDWYAYKTGYDLDTDCGSLCPEDKPFMVISPDALCRGRARGVDAKNMNRHSWRELTSPGEEIPQYIQFQVWYYMLGLDYEAYDVCALIGGEPHIFSIEREEDTLKVLEERTFEWHERYVVRGEEPPPEPGVITARWLQRAFAHHKRPDMRLAQAGEQKLLDEYLQLRIDLLAANPLLERKAQLEALLKRCVADSEGLAWPGGEFTWRKPKDSSITDWKKLAERLMDPMPDDIRSRWITEHTFTKENSRRIHLKSDFLRDAEREVKQLEVA